MKDEFLVVFVIRVYGDIDVFILYFFSSIIGGEKFDFVFWWILVLVIVVRVVGGRYDGWGDGGVWE